MELQETSYWLELLVKSSIVPEVRLADLRDETGELIAIFVASLNTAKRKEKAERRSKQYKGISAFFVLHSEFIFYSAF